VKISHHIRLFEVISLLVLLLYAIISI